MLKIFKHTIVILLAAALVTGGIYLFVENGGMNLIAAAHGSGFSHEGFGAQSSSGELSQGLFNSGDSNRQLGGLSSLAIQLGKMAAITIFVTAVRGVIRLVKRSKQGGVIVN